MKHEKPSIQPSHGHPAFFRVRGFFQKLTALVLGNTKTQEIQKNQQEVAEFVRGKRKKHLVYKKGDGIVGCFYRMNDDNNFIIESKDYEDCCLLHIKSATGQGMLLHISPKILGADKGKSDLLVHVKKNNYQPLLQEGLRCMSGDIPQSKGPYEHTDTFSYLGGNLQGKIAEKEHQSYTVTLIGGDQELLGYLENDLRSQQFTSINFFPLGTGLKDIRTGKDKIYALLQGGEQLKIITI